MTYYVRVVKGNVTAALRELNRKENADKLKKIARDARHYVKPGEKRRRKREECMRRAEMKELYDNLSTIFKRRSRGF